MTEAEEEILCPQADAKILRNGDLGWERQHVPGEEVHIPAEEQVHVVGTCEGLLGDLERVEAGPEEMAPDSRCWEPWGRWEKGLRRGSGQAYPSWGLLLGFFVLRQLACWMVQLSCWSRAGARSSGLP